MSEGLKITVTLEPEIEDFVHAEVERGSFGSPSDYVEDLIRELRERDLARRKLRRRIAKSYRRYRGGTLPANRRRFCRNPCKAWPQAQSPMKAIIAREAIEDPRDHRRIYSKI